MVSGMSANWNPACGMFDQHFRFVSSFRMSGPWDSWKDMGLEQTCSLTFIESNKTKLA